MQCGGWSIGWQGSEGNDFWPNDTRKAIKASTLLDGLLEVQKVNKFEILYPQYTSFTSEVSIEEERRQFLEQLKKMKKNMTAKNTVIIGAFGEFPYAESEGDVNIPYCKTPDHPGCKYNPYINPYAPSEQPKTLETTMSKFEEEVYSEVKEADKSIPMISVLFSGRPRLVGSLMEKSNALIAAWLPGTSGGQGVINAITGDYIIRKNGQEDIANTLSMDWPRNMESLSEFPVYGRSGDIPKIDNPLFKVGYGLSSFTGNEEGKNLGTNDE